MFIPHITEEYYCGLCEEYFNVIDVNKVWICPKCRNYVQIRIVTENKDNVCFRVLAKDLNDDDYILLDRNDDFRRIIKIIDLGYCVQLNIEKYKALKVEKNKYILKLEGGWYH